MLSHSFPPLRPSELASSSLLQHSVLNMRFEQADGVHHLEVWAPLHQTPDWKRIHQRSIISMYPEFLGLLLSLPWRYFEEWGMMEDIVSSFYPFVRKLWTIESELSGTIIRWLLTRPEPPSGAKFWSWLTRAWPAREADRHTLRHRRHEHLLNPDLELLSLLPRLFEHRHS